MHAEQRLLHLLQVRSHRAQADKLHEILKMNKIILEKERLRQSYLEQQASYTRIGKPHRPVEYEYSCTDSVYSTSVKCCKPRSQEGHQQHHDVDGSD